VTVSASRPLDGLRLALSWLTVAPVPAGAVDAAAGRRAILLAPAVGALLGAVGAGLLAGLLAVGAPPLLAGLLVVGALALLTRGMHVDGLADTADGLGCYGPPQRALAVMRDGGAGPFAVVTLIVVLGAQASALAALGAAGRWGAVVLAAAAGRAAFAWCCRRGMPAARPEGLGALVAGSQPVAVPVLWWLVLAGGGTLVAPGRPWLGPLGVALSAAGVALLARHARRRFGGITGDVLGAASELATTAVLVACALAR
jgi:adenosylcobinamide-GDP ribazoletransferase